MSWNTLFDSSTKRASMYTWLGSTSIAFTTSSHASSITAGAVTITELDSWNAIAILLIFHVAPKSPVHVELSFSATSSAEACARRNTRVEILRLASDASAFASASAFSFAAASFARAASSRASARSCAAAATLTSSAALAAATAAATALDTTASSASGAATGSTAATSPEATSATTRLFEASSFVSRSAETPSAGSYVRATMTAVPVVDSAAADDTFSSPPQEPAASRRLSTNVFRANLFIFLDIIPYLRRSGGISRAFFSSALPE